MPAACGLQTEIAAASAPGRDLAALTGPGFAAEIARGLPTALTLACADPRRGARRCRPGWRRGGCGST